MREKIKHSIEVHFVGLFGVLMFFFYLALILLQTFFPKIAKYDFHLIYVTFIVLGTGLALYGFIPKQIDYLFYRFRYWLIQITDRLTPKSIFFIVLILIVIGFYLRVNNLGEKSFWVDEVITSYAAIGLLEHGIPVMPSGEIYSRALLNSYLIALSFKIFGINEFSARIVSVIFGTLIIPLVYLLGKEFGKRAGIIAAILITFSVFQILWAREARMYAQFQFFYLLTAYLFYIGIKRENSKLFLFSGISFVCAWYSHRLSLCFIPAAVIYILVCKRREFFKNRYFVYLSLAFLGLAVVYIILTGKTPLEYYPSTLPKWGQHTVLHYVFISEFFTLFVLAFISSIVSLLLWKFGLHENKNHLYVMINFFIPFTILSVASWKTARYAFFIFPFLVILASTVIDFYVIRNWGNNINVLCTKISTILRVKNEFVKNIKTIITIILILLFFIQVSSDICFLSHDSYNIYHDGPENWRKAGEFVKGHFSEDDKIAATLSLPALYYVGRLDYVICKGLTYANVTLLADYDIFTQEVKTKKGWVIADRWRLNQEDRTDPNVRDYIRNNMTYYPEGSDETIEVYSWGSV